jgi:hypothetical protein
MFPLIINDEPKDLALSFGKLRFHEYCLFEQYS